MRSTNDRHVIVTRFSVPCDIGGLGRGLHQDKAWLIGRICLLRRFYLPSTNRLGCPRVLLCSHSSASFVENELRGEPDLEIRRQERWYGGHTGRTNQILTRLDSDDMISAHWFDLVDRAPPASAYVSPSRLVLCATSGRIWKIQKEAPVALASFRNGQNPYKFDHPKIADLVNSYHIIEGPHLMQIVHGSNLMNRVPTDAPEIKPYELSKLGFIYPL